MTQIDTDRVSPGPGSLDDAVASITGAVARRLTARYIPLYAAVAVMLLVAAVAPSRVDDGSQASAEDFGLSGEFATSAGDTSPDTDPVGGTSPPPPATPSPAIPVPAGDVSLPDPVADPAPPADPGLDEPPADDGTGAFADDGDAGDQGDGSGGFAGGASACPVEFGEDPVVGRGVAGVLLSAASPALSLLGPFGPNAVPALGLASPVLPIIAPVVDKLDPYIRMLNPLFLQLSELGTTLWQGPLQPLEAPLLALNAAVVQPLEVELLAALAGPIDQLNATPLTPCLQRLVYNLVAPLPIPTP